MKTSYGLTFNILNAEEIDRFSGYDRVVAANQVANCGKIIIDAVYEQPIDDEYDLEEIYKLINA